MYHTCCCSVGCFPSWGDHRCSYSSYVPQRGWLRVQVRLTRCPLWWYCREGISGACWPRCRHGNTSCCCGSDGWTIWGTGWFLWRWWPKSGWLACAPHTWLRSDQPWWTGATGCCGCCCCNGILKLIFLTINHQSWCTNQTTSQKRIWYITTKILTALVRTEKLQDIKITSEVSEGYTLSKIWLVFNCNFV
jgi:hypothetical protein